ncbi:hypothetical protein, partial [Ferrimicrobium sp.]|uniref:hypothetical protein n=1 Tax=Ferrimicrobium sp. TaxID=2926050 RepID=UPI002614D40C
MASAKCGLLATLRPSCTDLILETGRFRIMSVHPASTLLDPFVSQVDRKALITPAGLRAFSVQV